MEMIVAYSLMFPVHQPGRLRLIGNAAQLAKQFPVQDANHVPAGPRRRAMRVLPGAAQHLDFRFVDVHLHLHLSKVGKSQDRLPFANHGPFFDLRLLRSAETPSLIIRVHHHAAGRSLDHALFQLSFEPLQSRFLQIKRSPFGTHLCFG